MPKNIRYRREIGKVTWDIGDLHIALLMSSVEPDNVEEEPTTFKEVWWHPGLNARDKWRTLIMLEFHSMIERGVWRDRSTRNKPG